MKKNPKNVRFTQEQDTAIHRIASHLGVGFADVVRMGVDQLVQSGRVALFPAPATPTERVGEQVEGYGPVPVAFPLVEQNVAAGEGTLPFIPIEERAYFFRADWLRRKGEGPKGKCPANLSRASSLVGAGHGPLTNASDSATLPTCATPTPPPTTAPPSSPADTWSAATGIAPSNPGNVSTAGGIASRTARAPAPRTGA